MAMLSGMIVYIFQNGKILCHSIRPLVRYLMIFHNYFSVKQLALSFLLVISLLKEYTKGSYEILNNVFTYIQVIYRVRQLRGAATFLEEIVAGNNSARGKNVFGIEQGLYSFAPSLRLAVNQNEAGEYKRLFLIDVEI